MYLSIVYPIVKGAMEGYHGSVCAYGQTATGKTFSIQGTRKHPGILPLAMVDCFKLIKSSVNSKYILRVSYMEIYNECLRDLLSPSSPGVRIVDGKREGILVCGLKEEVVVSPEQVFAHISTGETHRHVGKTNANENSSRSHTIFRLIIECRETQSDKVRISTLQIVDLAGSESMKMAQTSGNRKNEGAFINKSLLTFGTVIRKLSEQSSDPNMHIPYRNSKLTRVLQPSLEGNSRIALICTITPELADVSESMNTLQFATRAKLVQTSARVNEEDDTGTLLQRYEEEISELKEELARAQKVESTSNESSLSFWFC